MKNLLLLSILLFSCSATVLPPPVILNPPTPGFSMCNVQSTGYIKVNAPTVAGVPGEHIGNVFPEFNAFCFLEGENLIYVPQGDTINIFPISSWGTLAFNNGMYEILFTNTSTVECERMN